MSKLNTLTYAIDKPSSLFLDVTKAKVLNYTPIYTQIEGFEAK
jgi:hypothetical protein